MGDSGKEWLNKDFEELMKQNDIYFYHVDPKDNHTLGIINIFCKTIRSMINKYNLANNTNTY